jgi:hypothetical protein
VVDAVERHRVLGGGSIRGDDGLGAHGLHDRANRSRASAPRSGWRPGGAARVDRLEAEGVVQGYFAQVDPARGTQTQVVLSTLFERPF